MVNAYAMDLTFNYGHILGCTSTKVGLMCLAQGHNAVTPVRLEPNFIYTEGL